MHYWLHVQITHTSSSVMHQHSEWPLCCGVGLSYIRCSGPAWEPVRLLLEHSHQSLIKPVYRSSAPWQNRPSQSQSAGELVYGAVVSFHSDERERTFLPLLRWAECFCRRLVERCPLQLSLAPTRATRPDSFMHQSRGTLFTSSPLAPDDMDLTNFFLLHNPDS